MDKKKILMLIVTILIFVIILIISKFTPIKITNLIDRNTLYRTSNIISSDNSKINVDYMIKDMKQSKYKKYKGNVVLDNAIYFIFLDKNNNILFKYVDTNYNNVVGFEINGQINFFIKKGILN